MGGQRSLWSQVTSYQLHLPFVSNNPGQVTSYQLHLPFVSNNSGQCHRWKQILTYSSLVLVGIYEGAVRRPSKAEFFVMLQIPKIISGRRLRWFRSLSRSRGTRDVRQFFDWKCSAKYLSSDGSIEKATIAVSNSRSFVPSCVHYFSSYVMSLHWLSRGLWFLWIHVLRRFSNRESFLKHVMFVHLLTS